MYHEVMGQGQVTELGPEKTMNQGKFMSPSPSSAICQWQENKVTYTLSVGVRL